MQGLQGLLSINQGIKGVTNSVTVFDFSTDSWDTAAPLNTPRVFATAVALHDSIYVMGGMDDQGNPLNSMEVYDPRSNTWHYSALMLRYRVGAAAVVYGDSILVFGGGGANSSMPASGMTTGPLGSLHKLVEIYSPAVGLWVPSDSIYLGRAFHQAVRVGRYIYILGGLGATFGPLSLVEKYVPGQGTIDRHVLLSDGRYFFATIKLRDSVYVISGLANGQSYLDSYYSGVSAMSLGSDGSESEPEDMALPVPARASFVADIAPDSTVYLFGGLSPGYQSGQVADPNVAQIWSVPTTVISVPNSLPETFDLKQNYPNPFNPTTTIRFDVPAPGMNVKLEVFNLLGEKVATLTSGYLSSGEHSAIFNGANYASGIYIYKLSNENGSIYRKMVLIK